MNIATVGIDLAKNIFALHGVDQMGRAVLVKPRVARDQLLPLIASQPPASSAWKPARARTTGRVYFGLTATPSN